MTEERSEFGLALEEGLLEAIAWKRGEITLETRNVDSSWDVTEYLDSEEAIALFLEAVHEENDPSLLAAALEDIAKAHGLLPESE